MSNFSRQFFYYGVGRMRTMLTSRRCTDLKIVTLFLTAVLLVSLMPTFPFLIEAALTVYLLAVTVEGFVAARRIGVLRL